MFQVAPPHGVFPFGNITTMIGFPRIFGGHMLGLASSAALKAPIFRQILCSIGAIDASRESATKVRVLCCYHDSDSPSVCVN
jgi:hypothetical protein